MLDFEAIYREYEPKIRRYCFLYLRDQEQAEDMAQDILLSVYQALPKLAGQEQLYLSAYIYRAARNRVISCVRHRVLIAWHELDEDIQEGRDFTEDVEQRDTVHHALMRLSPFHRETLLEWVRDRRACVHSGGFKMAASRAKKKFKAYYREEERAS